MTKRLNIAVLYGGRSGEHEVSLRSSASVLRALDKSKYIVTPIGMDKNGRCFLNRLDDLLDKESLPVETPNAVPVPSLLVDGRFFFEADVVFPVVHGPLYEDGALQGLLALANVAYVGCDVLSSAIGMDKDVSRQIVCDDEIRATSYRRLSSYASEQQKHQFCEEVVSLFGWPLFVKPCALGSSVGIHKVYDMAGLQNALTDAARYDDAILVEAFVKGREIELAVLENHDDISCPFVSLPGEIEVQHQDGFYSYTAKYLESEKTALHIPAVLKPEIISRLQKYAAEIFRRFHGRGMARVDFFVDEVSETIYFNEVNTLPGFTSISMYPKLWESSGIPYTVLLDQLIALAQMHHRRKLGLVTHYQ